MKKLTVHGNTYVFDKEKNHLLKRGLMDVYDQSKEVNEWVILDEYILWSARLQKIIIIPRWMVTDLSSIPKGLRWLISVNERHRLPSLPHDFGYKFSDSMVTPKELWDLIFQDFMREFGTSKFKRWVIYTAVKLGGQSSWEDVSKKFIPVEHRKTFIDAHPRLKLKVEDGEYDVV